MMTFQLKLGRSAFLLALLAMPLTSHAQSPTAAKPVAPADKTAAPAANRLRQRLQQAGAQADPAAKASDPAAKA
ncbi:MAG: hypothetical protein WDN31_03775 [Hyphomicrobium sp.]